MSQPSGESQTAQEFIASQLQLEADAREALPYQFDTCTRPLGPLRQSLFACLTCNPPPSSTDNQHGPAAICYSCSISCHGEHDLVELFSKRNFVCDCGSTRLPSSAPCTLRINPATSQKGDVTNEPPAESNKYNQNFSGHFCGCGEEYNPELEKGTMFQCLGLGHVQEGGCGEDWWHPECLMGLPRNQNLDETEKVHNDPDGEAEIKDETDINHDSDDAPQSTELKPEEQDEAPLPPGFPAEDDFDHFICYKCVDSNPWIKQYAGTPGFLGPIFHKPSTHDHVAQPNEPSQPSTVTRKRSADDETEEPASKKVKADPEAENNDKSATVDVSSEPAKDSEPTSSTAHEKLPPASKGSFSMFLNEDFRDHFCRCPECFPRLAKHPQLLEEEEAYEPPVSESDAEEQNGRASVGSGSTYERGEALLSNMDRVKAIEGVMVYNHLRDKVKSFLQPFAESGQAVGAEDIKAYFEKLRGDEEGIKLAGASAGADETKDDADGRREQGGY